MSALWAIVRALPLLPPGRARRRQRLTEISQLPDGMHMLVPLSYLAILASQRHSAVVLTESGGIQEETTDLGVPCLTLRENTERPFTAIPGANVFVGHDRERFRGDVDRILAGNAKQVSPIPLRDGRARARIAKAFIGTTLCAP